MKAHPPKAKLYLTNLGLLAVRYSKAGDPGSGLRAKIRFEVDTPLDKPPRPCARCGKSFQQTLRRRLMCLYCYTYAEHSWAAEPEDD